MTKLNIVGGGLAGAEAAWQAAEAGIEVNLYEMRKDQKITPAHKSDKIAELVCSNSFRNDEVASAIGLLHEEMRRLGSIIMKSADQTKLPAGSALAVDRELFSEYIESALNNHPKIIIISQEIKDLPKDGKWIIATGPLTSASLTDQIINLTGQDQLAFFDAIAPIILKDSIDFSIVWFQSRYDKIGPGGSGDDYINCPLNKEQYHNFVEALISAEKTEFKEWEKDTPYFNGCLPIEVMAQRGIDTLRFGPMKPVGLTNPHSAEKPYAVIQLRQDNKLGSLYNMVGFQTKMKYADQKRVFSMIPGLKQAEFVRLGGLHRNTFINSPNLLGSSLELKIRSNIRFAGQITGVEGYVESAAIGLLAGKFAANEILNKNLQLPPTDTAIGSLLAHLTMGAQSASFQPMNINFGLMPPLDKKIPSKQDRYKAISDRALKSLELWMDN